MLSLIILPRLIMNLDTPFNSIVYQDMPFNIGSYPSHEVITTTLCWAWLAYKANVVGLLIALLVDTLFFSYLYNHVFKKLFVIYRFFISSLISTILILFIYTVFIAIMFIHRMYPWHWLLVSEISFIANIIIFSAYTFIFSFIVKYIDKYLAN